MEKISPVASITWEEWRKQALSPEVIEENDRYARIVGELLAVREEGKITQGQMDEISSMVDTILSVLALHGKSLALVNLRQ